MSYILVVGTVLLNVVLAVLLDEFLTKMAKSCAVTAEENSKETDTDAHYLDPLMEVLSRFQSIDDLIESIELIFTRLDADGSGTIGFFEMSDRLNGILPNIYLSLENLMDLKKTFNPAEEFSADGFELSQQEFQTVCVSHLKDYLLREANKVRTTLKGNWLKHVITSEMQCVSSCLIFLQSEVTKSHQQLLHILPTRFYCFPHAFIENKNGFSATPSSEPVCHRASSS